MEDDPRPGHHAEADELRIAAFVADDRRRRDAVDVGQRDRVPGHEHLPVGRGELALGIAVRLAPGAVADAEAVQQRASADDGGTDEDVDPEPRRKLADRSQRLA